MDKFISKSKVLGKYLDDPINGKEETIVIARFSSDECESDLIWNDLKKKKTDDQIMNKVIRKYGALNVDRWLYIYSSLEEGKGKLLDSFFILSGDYRL